jgi:hypothetical protein
VRRVARNRVQWQPSMLNHRSYHIRRKSVATVCVRCFRSNYTLRTAFVPVLAGRSHLRVLPVSRKIRFGTSNVSWGGGGFKSWKYFLTIRTTSPTLEKHIYRSSAVCLLRTWLWCCLSWHSRGHEQSRLGETSWSQRRTFRKLRYVARGDNPYLNDVARKIRGYDDGIAEDWSLLKY